MLTTKLRTVPIRLFCLIATFLALALPAKAAEWALEVNKSGVITSYDAANISGTEYKAENVTIPQGATIRLKHNYDYHGGGDMSISNNETNTFSYWPKGNVWSNWTSGAFTGTFYFSYNGDNPYFIYVEAATVEPEPEPQPVEWTSYYLITADDNWAVKEANKFSKTGDTWSVTIPTLTKSWRILGYNSESDKQIYYPNENNVYGFNDGWKTDTNTASTTHTSGSWAIHGESTTTYTNTISFTEDNGAPKGITVDFSKVAPETPVTPDSYTVYAYGRFKDSSNTWNSDGYVALTWNATAQAYTVEIPQNSDNAFRLNIDGTDYYPVGVTGSSPYLITTFGSNNKFDIKNSQTSGIPDCWGIKPMDSNLTYTLYVDVANNKLWVTTDGEVTPVDPLPASDWTVEIGPNDNGNGTTAYNVELVSVNGTKALYKATVTLTSGDIIIIKNNQNTYYRNSNNDNNIGGWYINRTNRPDNPYTRMPNTPVAGNSVSYLKWNSQYEPYVGADLFFTYDLNDNGSQITNIYVDRSEWDGVYAAGYPHVYLLSTILNNRVVTPEYMLTSSDGNKTFHLNNFAVRNTKVRTNNNGTYNADSDQKYTVRVYYAPNRYIDCDYTESQAGVPDFGMDVYQAGWDANAIFTLVKNGTDMTASTLKIENTNSAIDWKANNLPYLGILGENFKQENKYTTPLDFNGKMGNTDLGWQEAYIQYDAAGRPIIQNGKALYNTLWPPRNNILMQAKLPGNNVPLNVSTRTLRFYPTVGASSTPEIKTGSEWVSTLKNEDSKAYEGLQLVEGQHYVRYVSTNMWMQGTFKIWTGWAGQKCDWGAQWNNHLYFSYPGNAGDEAPMDIEAGKTYNSTSDVNARRYNFPGRQFLSTVEIFIPVFADGTINATNNMSNTRLYTTKSRIQAAIDATKNNTTDLAYYYPTVTLGGSKIDSYKIVRCDFNVNPGGNDINQWQPVDRGYNYRNHDDADAIVAEYNGEDGQLDQDAFNAKFVKDITGGDGNPWIKDGENNKLASGTYFYYLQINYTDVDGDKHTEVVTSPYIAVLAGEYETNVRVYQLVRNTEGGATDKYVTYAPNFHTQYNVTLDENDKIVNVEERDAADRFDYSSEYAQWTAKVGVATNLPGLYRFNTDPNIERKIVTEFTIRYNDEVVEEVKDAANEAFENRPGQSFYAVKDFYNAEDGTFDPFTDKWDANFTSRVWNKDGSVENRETKEENRDPSYLNLTMPVYGVGNVTFQSNGLNGSYPVAVNDPEAGEDHIHTVESALVNEFDVFVSIKAANVAPEIVDAYNKIVKPLTLNVGDLHTATIADFGTDKDYKYVNILNEDPNNWIENTGSAWVCKEQEVALNTTDGAYFSDENMLVYVAEDAVKKAKVEAYPCVMSFTPEILRAKVKVGDNEFKERLYLVQTALPLNNVFRSTIENGTLANNALDEYLLLKKNGEVANNRYCAISSETWEETTTNNDLKHYHKYYEIEDAGRLIVLAESENSSAWFDDMFEYNWISDEEISKIELELGLANFFKGDTKVEGDGVTLATVAAAPALQADGETATHYVLYPPKATAKVSAQDITTAVDQIEADEAWVEAGAGYINVLANGVQVYDAAGMKVAEGAGRYDVNAGVYLALKGKKAVKLYVK